MSDGNLILFAGGGTGGHLYPSLSVAKAIRDQSPSAGFVFFGTERDIDAQVLAEAGEELIPQPIQPPRLRKPWTLPGFGAAWIRTSRKVRAFFEAHNPSAVIGTGGYASAPAVIESSRAGIPTFLISPDAIPGKANKFLANRAHVIFVQWQIAQQGFPVNANVKVAGCPIRSTFLDASRKAGIERFGLQPEMKTLLVTGASQGARTINETFLSVLKSLEKYGDRWQILHLAGTRNQPGVASAYARHNLNAKVLGYTDHMAEAMAVSDLIIGRAGASFLAEVTGMGKPSILMPYPFHKDQHQEQNALVLVRNGAAKLVRDQVNAVDNAPVLLNALEPLLEKESLLQLMSKAARTIGKPDAAEVIAHDILALIESHTKSQLVTSSM